LKPCPGEHFLTDVWWQAGGNRVIKAGVLLSGWNIYSSFGLPETGKKVNTALYKEHSGKMLIFFFFFLPMSIGGKD
jgi:hypothetical protein